MAVPVKSTTYIGSLFEIARNSAEPNAEPRTTVIKHIFAGSQRVCSIEGTATTPAEVERGGIPSLDNGQRDNDTKVAVPKVLYYHSDHLGSSNVITDGSGKQVGCYEYTPYGSLARDYAQLKREIEIRML